MWLGVWSVEKLSQKPSRRSSESTCCEPNLRTGCQNQPIANVAVSNWVASLGSMASISFVSVKLNCSALEGQDHLGGFEGVVPLRTQIFSLCYHFIKILYVLGWPREIALHGVASDSESRINRCWFPSFCFEALNDSIFALNLLFGDFERRWPIETSVAWFVFQ